jgi:hypothetical protein
MKSAAAMSYGDLSEGDVVNGVDHGDEFDADSAAA